MARPISSFNREIEICSSKDQFDSAGNVFLSRKSIYKTWASIEAKKASSFSANGAALSVGARTHIVTVLNRVDIELTNAAWVYHKPLISPPAWYKVLSYKTCDTDQECIEIEVAIMRQGDDIAKPSQGIRPLL
jgi:head-tail adaptor